jgi:hypothetical protein
MSKKISDYAEIIKIYNTDGQSHAYAYIRKQYAVKNPYCVIKRMKQTSTYNYDKETDHFLEAPVNEANSVFMGLNELCQGGRNTQTIQPTDNGQSIEKLIRELIEDRLLQLSQYIQMNQLTRTVLIDQTSMLTDGYHVVIH